MLLPCPECQTVYNAEPSVYKPGMAFQCVSCDAVVVVPTGDEANSQPQEPAFDLASDSASTEAAAETNEESDAFDFDLDLPASLDVEEPQPTMVFDPASLEEAVSDAFGGSEVKQPATSDISDNFFDEPLDGLGASIPTPFTPGSEIDAQATRELNAGIKDDSAQLPELDHGSLEQPTMVLSSRDAVGEQSADGPLPSAIETRVLPSSGSDAGLDAVDLLDDLFNEKDVPELSGASLPAADALTDSPQASEPGGFDLTDDVFGGSGAQPLSSDDGAGSPVADSDASSGLAGLDFDDLVNQPLGSDDVSFSFDDLASIGPSEPTTALPQSEGSLEAQQPPTEVLSQKEQNGASEVKQPSGAAEKSPRKSDTWLGLGLVAVALALIASTADIASLLDKGLEKAEVTPPTSTSPASAKSAEPKENETVASQQNVEKSQPAKASSTDDVFGLDYPGLVRLVESSGTAAEVKALAQYRLGRFFGEAKSLAEASAWAQAFTPKPSSTQAETIIALAIGATLPELAKSARDSAELMVAKKAVLGRVEKALVASALSGPKQRTASIALFKDALTDAPSDVEVWQLFLEQHSDRDTKAWAEKTLKSQKSALSSWQQARFVELFRMLGKPELVVDLLLKNAEVPKGAPSVLSESDQFALARLDGLRGIFKGDLKPWKIFAELRQKSRPSIENFIAQSRVNSLLDGKISPAIIERARNETAPVVQARLYYEATVLGRDLALEEATSPLVQEMVKSLSPTKTGGYFQLARGELALLMGNRSLARRFINAAMKVNPRLTEASLASLMLIDRDKDVFLRELSKLHQRGDSPRVAWQLARVFSERNNHGGALRLIEGLLVESPTIAPLSTLLLSFLDNLVANGDFSRLGQLSESLYQVNPQDTELITLMVQASAPTAVGDFPDRLMARMKWTERLHKLDPANRDNLYLWVEAMLDAEKQTEARDVLKKLLDEYPDARGTAKFTQLTARSWIAENPSVARQFLKESVRHERMASSHVLLGEIEEKRQSQVDAIEQYLLAIELEPSLTDIRFRVGRLLHEVGRYPEASVQLEVVVNSSPANVVARELLGDTLKEQGLSERALRQYRRVLEQGNVQESLLMKTARLQMYELNRLEDAVRSLQQAVLLNDKNSEILYLLGVALKDLNQLERARRQFQKYLRLDPNGDYAEEVRGILKNL